MKVYVASDELYPFFWLQDKKSTYNFELELSEEELRSYQQTKHEMDLWQDKFYALWKEFRKGLKPG